MGSILSRVDSRQVAKDDDILSAGGVIKNKTKREATSASVTSEVESAREGAVEVSALSLSSSSKKSAKEKVARRFSDTTT